MGKLQDKRIELAKRVLDTTDETTLMILAEVLKEPFPYALPETEIKAFEDYLARYERGEEKPKAWAVVKRRIAGRNSQ